GKDRVLRIFNAATGEVMAEYHGHNDAIGQVAYSPDGQSIWTVGDGTARCWDAATQGDPRVLRHMSYVYSVAYSPDGRWFATAGWHDPDGRASDIYLWDAASSQLITVLHGHTSWIAALAITPDGKQIVSVANDESVRVWDATTGRGRKLPFTAARLDAPHGHRISISPDGRLLAVGEGQRVRLWDLQSDAEQAALPLSLTGVRIAVFSPDGTRLAVAGTEPEVQIVAVATGEVLAVLRGHTQIVNAVTFSPDGKRILTASQDRSVRLWDAATGALQTVLGGARGGHTDTVYAAVFHPDGTRIATGGRDRAIRIWDTATGDELVRLAGHTDYVFTLAFSPDGATLLSGSGDGSVRVWDTAPLRERVKARRELEALRPQAEALVDGLGGDPDRVAEHLRSDTELSAPLRRAVWHALLRRSTK
ncbi:MAG TPA: WD40 repeat domain-containing protein, partial [Gemmataceae bacterium]|nr:WD40 repeat domain-containing protein [Gemmataceae bacterium]